MVLRKHGNTWEEDIEVPAVGVVGGAFALRDGDFQRYEDHILGWHEVPEPGADKTEKQFQLHVLVACDSSGLCHL